MAIVRQLIGPLVLLREIEKIIHVFVYEGVPSGTAGIDDGVVGAEDASDEMVLGRYCQMFS